LQLKKLKKINNKKKNILKIRIAKILHFGLKSFNKLNTLKEIEKKKTAKIIIKVIAKSKPFAFSLIFNIIFNFFNFFISF